MNKYGLVIPCAGKGERLSEFTKFIPKPLLALNSKCKVLDNILDVFHNSIQASLMTSNYIGVTLEKKEEFQHFCYMRKKSRNWEANTRNYNIITVNDNDEIEHNAFVDTQYLLKQALKDNASKGYFVISGDAVISYNDVSKFFKIVDTSKIEFPLVATIKCRIASMRRKAGQLILAKNSINTKAKHGKQAVCSNKVLEFQEKPPVDISEHIACSMYYIPKKVVEKIVDNHTVDFKQMGDILNLIMETEELYAYMLEDFGLTLQKLNHINMLLRCIIIC